MNCTTIISKEFLEKRDHTGRGGSVISGSSVVVVSSVGVVILFSSSIWASNSDISFLKTTVTVMVDIIKAINATLKKIVNL